MAKTLKQIADELGEPKYRLYRFLKQENISATYQEGNKMYYDEEVEEIIKSNFPLQESEKTLQADSATIQESEKTLQVDSATMQEPEKTLQANFVTMQEPEKTLQANSVTMQEPKKTLQVDSVTMQENFATLQSTFHEMAATFHESTEHNHQIIETLLTTHQKELESRDEQIRQLQSELAIERQHNHELSDKLAQLADQAQQLQLIQMQPPAMPVPDEEPPKQKPSFWKRIFGRKE